MAAYIMSGTMSKLLMAPKNPTQSEAVKMLEKEADILEAKLEQLRSSVSWNDIPNERGNKGSAMYSEIRAIRKQLSKIDTKVREIMKKDSPEWFEYWGV